MPKLDLQAYHLRLLLTALKKHAPHAEAWAYGSRVNGSGHEGSDLDLVLRNPDGLDQPFPQLDALRAALSESDLPILVEVLDWARIPPDFRQEIEREHAVVLDPAAAHSPAVK